MKITFIGATQTVTGSKFLLEKEGYRLLLDCGLFQGLKKLRLRNRADFPVKESSIDSIVLTHAHLDHSGFIPRLIKKGFKGSIYATHATKDLCQILLPDSGFLQEEEARYAAKKGFSRHEKPEPLYTEEEAQESLQYFQTREFHAPFQLGPFEVTYLKAGHILGAASVLIKTKTHTILFSGDLGRQNDLVMQAPERACVADVVVMESTYGGRLHSQLDPRVAFRDYLEWVIEKKGVFLIPSFAVGRAQTVLFCLYDVFKNHPELRMPVYVNSPMATNVTELFEKYGELHKLDQKTTREVLATAHYVRSVEESIALNKKSGPHAIISASGMLTGGRVLHHLKSLAPGPENLILLPGFQAPGTRGQAIVAGATETKIHGEYVPVRARIAHLDMLSAHADQGDLLWWLSGCSKKPKRIFLVHGEEASMDALRLLIKDRVGIEPEIPEKLDSFEL